MWGAKSGSVATLATAFFLYLAAFFPGLNQVFYVIPLPLGAHGAPLEIRNGQLFGIVLILVLGGINYLGVRIGGGVQVAVTVIKVGLIFFIIAVGLGWGHAAACSPAPAPAAALTIAGFFAALVAAPWPYDGASNVSMVSSERTNPQRKLPRALIWGTIAVIVIYL